MKKLAKILASSLFLATVLVAPPAHAAAAEKPTEFTLSNKGDQNVFDKTKLTVKAGAKVKLTFKNTTAKGSGMQHNWVLVKIGKLNDVVTASVSAGPDKGWVAVTPDVIAHTKLVDPQMSDTIEFTAPAEKGVYPFVCTFPGHSATMKGELTVK